MKFIEANKTFVRYKLWPVDSNSVIITETRYPYRKVVFESGSIAAIKCSLKPLDSSVYDFNRKNVIRFNGVSWLRPVYNFSLERSVNPGTAVQVGFGYINHATNLYQNDCKGQIFCAGVKFYTNCLYGRNAHLLKGFYLSPSLYYITYNYQETAEYYINLGWGNSVDRHQVMDQFSLQAGALMLNLGNQFIFSNLFSVNIYGGIGIGYVSDRLVKSGVPAGLSSDYTIYHQSPVGLLSGYGLVSEQGSDLISVMVGGGFEIGVLIGRKGRGLKR
ncbi:MAG: DUF3575 domain-containing protein [Bacteroidia bacterium]|nr:DUF3575 domain-containing protein [Bacteroidia bacterium]